MDDTEAKDRETVRITLAIAVPVPMNRTAGRNAPNRITIFENDGTIAFALPDSKVSEDVTTTALKLALHFNAPMPN